jgi:hypothetical protein
VDATLVFLAVVAARFLLPLLIPRFPLPAIIGCLVLDAVDQTIFQTFGYDPPGYQSYDKAMDVFYLAVAYMSTMRNWTSVGAFRVSQALYFYRLVGVVAFEATQWRALLLVFPNTFEYFFIAYETIRLRWDPARLSFRFWVVTAAVIWVVVKLPQEWWIHVAKLDFTDAVADVPWFGPAVVLAAALLAVVLLVFVRPRLAPPNRTPRLGADPLPTTIDEPAERHAWVARHARVWSAVTLEKVVLVGLLSVIFAQLLPGLRSTNLELFVGLGAFVVINAALSVWAARSGRSVDSLVIAFAVRVAVNFALVLAAELLLDRGAGDLNADAALFFVVLLSLVTTMHDGFRPVFEVRAEQRPGDMSETH